jgi:hypothetical protein
MKLSTHVLVTPLGGMALVSLYCTMTRVDACELNIFAKIVTTLHAEKALAARNAWLDGDAVTYKLSHCQK